MREHIRSGFDSNGSLVRKAILGGLAVVVIGMPDIAAAEAQPLGLNNVPGTYESIVASLRKTDFQTVETTNQPARLTMKELAAGQKAWRDALRSMEVDLTYRHRRLYDTSGERAAEKTGRGIARDLRGEVHFALKGDKRLIESSDTSPYTRANKDPKFLESVYGRKPHFRTSFDGRQSHRYESRARTGLIEPSRHPALENDAVPYFDAIFFAITDSMATANKSEWNVEVACQSESYYRLLPQLERVDGHLCHVISSGWDTIWIDPDEGYGVRRRVHFRRQAAKDPGQLGYVQVCRDFVNAGKNVWLPTKTIQLVYTTYDQPPHDRGRLHWIKEVDASPRVADLSDSLFEVPFPPGTEVFDYVKQIRYLVPAGQEQLESAIASAQPLLLDADGKPSPVGVPARGRRLPPLVFWLNGACLAVGALVLALRWRRARASRS